MLITEQYRVANAHLHATTDYGVTAPRYLEMIGQVAAGYACDTILDYGSGTRKWIERNLGRRYAVQSYDPCVAGLDAEPNPADMLVSCDVLEHIEPECLDDVLDHMASKTRRVAFLTVSTRPAGKTLPDGRNAHLIQEQGEWWLPRLWARWRLQQFVRLKGEFVAIMEAKP